MRHLLHRNGRSLIVVLQFGDDCATARMAGCFGAGAVRQVGDNYTDRFVLAGSEFCGFQLHQEVCALGGIDRVLALPDGFGRVARKLLASKKKVTTCRLASRLASPRLASPRV